ncbi:MAG: hypothetical protein FWF01_02205 [Alphaproteobacteria bacterium]|nr:hypothetical protein [Alphaproteobacteria bacterium]
MVKDADDDMTKKLQTMRAELFVLKARMAGIDEKAPDGFRSKEFLSLQISQLEEQIRKAQNQLYPDIIA